MTTIIRVKRERTRKPAAPRTCCPTHTDTCKFGRQHVWCGPYLLDAGKPVNGEVWSHPNSVKCAYCNGTCDAEVE